MKKKYQKVTLWCLGVVLLGLLIQLPIWKAVPNYKAIAQPLAGQTIVIDPGHGGPDGGAKGKNGMNEKEITLKIAHILKSYAEQAGAIVYLTRVEDEDLADKSTKGLSRRKSEDIRNRLKFIHEKEADFYLSIHLNAIPDSRWSGAQTFYYSSLPENKHLAEVIQSELVSNLKNTDREALEVDAIYLLKHAEVPGALLELGFLSNEKEQALLESEEYQKKLAAIIYQGMMLYVMEDLEE